MSDDEKTTLIVVKMSHAERRAIEARLGCNVYGRLAHIAGLITKEKDAEAAQELRELLAFLIHEDEPPKDAEARAILQDALRLFNDHSRFGLRRPERGFDSYKVAGDIDRYLKKYPD